MLARQGLAAGLSLALAFVVLPADGRAGPPDAEAAPVPPPPAPPESPASAAILPIEVEGELSDSDRASLTSELVGGLQRGAFGVVLPNDVTAKVSDAAQCDKPRCFKKIAEDTGSTHVVKTKLLVRDRDYRVRLELVDGESGNVLASAEDGCEICGVSDVGGLIATAAATLRTKLDALASGPATLQLSSDPASAVVTMDGNVIGTTPIENMPVIPGKHVLRVSREGYIAIEREVTFVEGVSEKLSFSLEKLPSRLPGRGWGWATLVVGAGALGTGIAFASLDDRQYTLKCEAPTNKDSAGECRYLWNTHWIAVGASVAGAALITLGVAILVNSAGKTKRVKEKSGAQSRRPDFGIGPGSVMLRGRF